MAKRTPPMFRQGDLIHVRLGPYDQFGRREQFKARIEFDSPTRTRLIVLHSVGCTQVTSGDTSYSFLDPLHQWAVAQAQDIQATRAAKGA